MNDTSDMSEQAREDAAIDAAELKGWHMPGLDFPLIRLVLIAKAMDRLNQRSLADHAGMTMAEWRVLSRLAPGAGATVREIAELAWADRAEVSRAASALERRGLLARRDNPRDGRAPLLYCTTAGMAEYHRVRPLRAAHYDWMAGNLDAAERAEFDRLLTKLMLRIASAADPDAPSRPGVPAQG
ncbi:MarR family winged helix-turn-helix transcriptional regulator [Novosphingobium piscinae]|uniref:Winged helix-turn-helix transcriptional regulator n=1 Tax=Novosphingobium piscinae TaxID=1507448 RepID=A0A7X1G0A6_9SPHN|nr:MarR family winged helix-turn-helix transcriptional regulator [Novosphingobium piscinae]MBC2670310.1 winged helix-turn-helix transcriptional regulator [Novosphingobium piscinae]